MYCLSLPKQNSQYKLYYIIQNKGKRGHKKVKKQFSISNTVLPIVTIWSSYGVIFLYRFLQSFSSSLAIERSFLDNIVAFYKSPHYTKV